MKFIVIFMGFYLLLKLYFFLLVQFLKRKKNFVYIIWRFLHFFAQNTSTLLHLLDFLNVF